MDNKDIILKVYEEIFNGHNLAVCSKYIKEDYIQHNPVVENGITGFEKFFNKMFTRTPDFHFDIKHLIAEGDYVVVHGHATTGKTGRGGAVVDIYRLENGKLAEHWDVLQQVPETTANGNTMF